MTISASKNNLAQEMFVRTADENYITARWCVANQLYGDFLWLSLHALEKYLKAVLLVNGRSARGFGHDIKKIYEKVSELAGALLPTQLERPTQLVISHWGATTPEQYMERMNRFGNADNRYAIYGFVVRSQDLHMLDAMVFAVRRLTCELDTSPFIGRDMAAPKITHRDLLKGDPTYYGRLFMPLDKLIAEEADTPRQRAALNLNFSFAPSKYPHEPMQGGAAESSPVILRRILAPLESKDVSTAMEGLTIAEWFKTNVQLPKEVEKQINDAMRKAMRIHITGPWKV